MSLSYPKVVLIVCTGLASLWGTDVSAATYVDALNLVELSVQPTASTAAGHVAWQFGIVPLDAANEVSSFDVATGAYGFSGTAFRQVNPNGLATVFNDFNTFFGESEDETTDTQFTFARSSLAVVPGSEKEDDKQLKAVFTSFTPIRVDSASVRFAQIVTPFGSVGEFYGGFAVRPISGGQGQLVEFGPISFSVTPGDFDFDGDVDGSDFLAWQRGGSPDPLSADDLTDWTNNYGDGALVASVATSSSVPEPSTVWLLCGLMVLANLARPGRSGDVHVTVF